VDHSTGKKARIAVIGAGWWATTAHIPAVQEHPQAELVLCDRDPAKLASAAAAYGINTTYANIDDMLAREALDGAIVVTNHASHYPLAKRCLQAGLHVLIDKPMTLYAWEAKELVELAQAKGRELLVGYPYKTIHLMPFAAAPCCKGASWAKSNISTPSLRPTFLICCAGNTV